MNLYIEKLLFCLKSIMPLRLGVYFYTEIQFIFIID